MDLELEIYTDAFSINFTHFSGTRFLQGYIESETSNGNIAGSGRA